MIKAELKEQLEHIKRMEVEGYREEYLMGRWRTWKCEVKTVPHDSYSIDWYFWFTLSKTIEDEEIRAEEIYFRYGHRLYVEASEIFYSKTGKEIKKEPLSTDMGNLNAMTKHTKKIQKMLTEEYNK